MNMHDWEQCTIYEYELLDGSILRVLPSYTLDFVCILGTPQGIKMRTISADNVEAAMHIAYEWALSL